MRTSECDCIPCRHESKNEGSFTTLSKIPSQSHPTLSDTHASSWKIKTRAFLLENLLLIIIHPIGTRVSVTGRRFQRIMTIHVAAYVILFRCGEPWCGLGVSLVELVERLVNGSAFLVDKTPNNHGTSMVKTSYRNSKRSTLGCDIER